MTATATMQRQQEKTGTWSNIFPPETVNAQQSALFVKKLLAVAVSNITYLRAIFPEHAFGDRCLEDLNLKILRDDSNCPGACQVIRWVKGCFDALDKKYLRMLIIGIYTDPNDPDTVIESYTFKFNYAEDGGVDLYRNNKKISSAHSAGETKKETIMLLRTIVVLTQSLHSLPDDVMMTMKLLYYEDITPPDYEPPGFKGADTDGFQFEDEPMNIKVGDVSTPFHTVKMRIKTDAKQFVVEDDGGEEIMENKQQESQQQEVTDEALDNAMEHEQGDEDNHSAGGSQPGSTQGGYHVVPEPTEADDAPNQTPAKPGFEDEAVRIATPCSQISQTTSNMEDLGVKCPCGCNEDDGLMILCSGCKYWQHGVCFMITCEENAPAEHICNLCGQPKDKNRQPTDPHLHGLSEIATQATCIWRRALMACKETNRLLAPNFARRLGVEMTVAQGLINRLEKEGIVKMPAKSKRLGKVVDKDKLSVGIEKYFKKTRKSIEEQMTEEQASQVEDTEDTKPDIEEIQSTKRGKKRKPTTKPVETEIEQLASRAEDISLSGNRTRTPNTLRDRLGMKDNGKPSPQPVETGEVEKDKKEKSTDCDSA